MKKILPKILGTALVFLLAFTMFGVFMPASEVEAGKSRWSTVNDPNAGGSRSNFVVADSEVIDIEVCDDGTMFAAILAEAANTGYTPNLVAGDYAILKSTTGGNTWRPTGFDPADCYGPDGLVGTPDDTPIVDIAASQSYSEDTTLWVAISRGISRTINGGTTFGSITPGILAGGETITSIDVAPDYLGAGINAVIGTMGAPGRVLLYTERAGGWGAVNALSWSPGPFAGAVTAAWVAFSPDYENDGEIIAVATDGASTRVRGSFQERAWDNEILATVPLQHENTNNMIVAEDASIAFPDDYDSLSAINLFVGIDARSAAAGFKGDVFRIIGQRFGSPTPSIRVDMNAHPNREFDAGSIAVAGPINDCTVIVGGAVSNDVRRTSNPTDTTPSWRAAGKRPTGTGNTMVKVANDFTTSGTVYAATSDGLTSESGVSRAMDGGSIYNGISIIDTPIMGMPDVSLASKNVMFLITTSSPAAAEPDGAADSLWRSTNGGSNWERIHATLQTDGMNTVEVSPDYDDDSTVYTGHIGATQMWKSANGGDTFNGVSARENISAWVVVDSTTLFVAGVSTEVWKSANSGLRWTRSQEKPVGTANSMVISPNFESDDSILIGNTNGRVYLSQDGGLNFRRQGGVNPGGAGLAVYAAFDNAYADSGIIFAAVANVAQGDVEGIYRWEVGESTDWDQINNNLAAAPVLGVEARGLVVTDGVLYASDAIANRGMQRSVSPKSPLQFAPGGFAAVGGGLVGGATMGDIEVMEGMVVAIDTTNNRLNGFTDTLATPTTLSAPKEKAVVADNTVTLQWASLPDATQYQRELRLDSAYTVTVSGFADNFTTATSDVLNNLVPGTTYYWRIRSEQPVLSPWARGSFTVKLADPTLVSPNPQEVFEVPIRPQFTWRTVVGAVSYELQMADNPFYADAWVKKPLAHTVWVWDEDLEYGTTYYWRVKAIGTGTESQWTESAFTTIGEPSEAPPAAPPQIVVQPPQVTVPPAPPAQPITIPQPIAPVYLWAIIIIGAILIIALIVLIVRTRRVV